MKKNRKRYVYDKQPSQRETLPELILRKWPEGEAEMDALLRSQNITYDDLADLDAEIARKNHRCIELIQRHGLPAHIMRTREECCLLIQAKTLIESCGIA